MRLTIADAGTVHVRAFFDLSAAEATRLYRSLAGDPGLRRVYFPPRQVGRMRRGDAVTLTVAGLCVGALANRIAAAGMSVPIPEPIP